MIESLQELTGEITPTQELTGQIDLRTTGGSINDVQVNGTSVVENKVAKVVVPTKVGDLQNDSGYITNGVDNLTNYYKKNETYTQTETSNLVGTKQDTLVSGTNIKTINNESILGNGNLTIEGQVVQVSTMPTASASELGKIYQYVGVDTNDYKNGYFYKCGGGIAEECLKTNGGAFVTTNVIPFDNKIVTKFKLNSHRNNVDVLHKADNWTAATGVLTISGNKWTFGYSGTGSDFDTTDLVDGQVHTVIYNGDNNQFSLDGNVLMTRDINSQNYQLCYFGDQRNSCCIDIDFYESSIINKSNDEVLHHFIPAQNNGTPALYDEITQTYYYDPDNAMTYQAGGSSYYWERIDVMPVDDKIKPAVINNSDSTYTISNLQEHYLYNLGEITSLTITAVDTIYVETNIFLESGTTPTTVSLPDSIENIGDAPTFTTASSTNTGTLTASKKYIISFLNGIAVWKEY